MDARTRSHCVNLEVSFPLVLGARTTRPHRAGGAKSYPSSLHIRIIDSFALRAQCGRDVRAPREIGLPLEPEPVHLLPTATIRSINFGSFGSRPDLGRRGVS